MSAEEAWEKWQAERGGDSHTERVFLAGYEAGREQMQAELTEAIIERDAFETGCTQKDAQIAALVQALEAWVGDRDTDWDIEMHTREVLAEMEAK